MLKKGFFSEKVSTDPGQMPVTSAPKGVRDCGASCELPTCYARPTPSRHASGLHPASGAAFLDATGLALSRSRLTRFHLPGEAARRRQSWGPSRRRMRAGMPQTRGGEPAHLGACHMSLPVNGLTRGALPATCHHGPRSRSLFGRRTQWIVLIHLCRKQPAGLC